MKWCSLKILFYMHYVYGRIRLAVKSILKDRFDESEMEKFTGCYEPYLWLPKNVKLINSFISHDEVKPYYINRLIENIIISCIITHYNLVKFGGYVVNRINIKNVLEDVQELVFDDVERMYGKGTNDRSILTAYNVCMKWKNNFFIKYIALYKEFKKHWNDGNPDEWITSRFEHGYFYKKRNKRHEKEGSKRTDWSWLDDKNSEELAREIIRRDIHYSPSMKEALKKRHIPVKSIKSEIIRINEEDKTFIIDCAIKRWFETMDDAKRNNFITAWKQVTGKQMTVDTFRLLAINAYGYREEWFSFYNCVNLKPIQSTLEGLSAQTTSNRQRVY